MVDENDVVGTYLNNDRNSLASMIGSLMLIELGVITNITEDGRAAVQLMRLAAGRVIELEDVELLFIGNSRGGAFTYCVGSICLLLCPRTLVEDTKSQLVRANVNTVHEYAGVKAIPLSNCYQSAVKVDYDDDGGFSVNTGDTSLTVTSKGALKALCKNYGMIIDDTGMSVFTSKGPSSMVYNPDGSVMEYLWSESKPVYLRTRQADGTEIIWRNGLEDATDEQLDDILLYEKWQWKEEYNADGTHTTTLYDADGNIIYSISKNADGTEDTTSTSPWSVIVTDSDGKEQVTLKATNDGKFTITTEDAVSIDAKGNVTVTTEGDASVSADGAINIEATKQGLLTLKNAVDSLGGILSTLCDNISKIDTVGSPASHSAGPGIIANMTMLKQKISQVLG